MQVMCFYLNTLNLSNKNWTDFRTLISRFFQARRTNKKTKKDLSGKGLTWQPLYLECKQLFNMNYYQ